MPNIGNINIFIGVILIVLSIPLVLKKVKMNHLYGFRFTKSFASDENWYSINHYGGKLFLYWSLPIIAAGLVYKYIPAMTDYALEFKLIPLLIFVPVIQVMIYAGKK
jgi:hypothetical protein